MTDVMAGTLVGAGCSAILLLIGAVAKGLMSAGEHKERLDSHETRLAAHQGKLDELPDKFVPRTELSARLDAMNATANRTEEWVKFLVKKEAIPPENH